ERVSELMHEKGLGLAIHNDQLKVERQEGVAGGDQVREHLVIRKTNPSGAEVAVALRVEPYGAQDLLISWRLFSQNPKTGQQGCTQSLVMVGASIALCMCGGAVIMETDADGGIVVIVLALAGVAALVLFGTGITKGFG